MKRHISSISFAIALGILGLAPALFANDHHGCTLRNVAATYGYTVSGIRNGIGPAASVGSAELNSDGTVTGAQSASFNGIILSETYTGTYTVNDDCTGTAVLNVVSSIPAFNRTSNLAVVWDDNEERFRMIFTDGDTILTGDAQRVH